MSLIKKRLDELNTEVDQYLNDIESVTGQREVMEAYVSDRRREALRYHRALIDDYQWWQALKNVGAYTSRS
jgi:hypothetical protein